MTAAQLRDILVSVEFGRALGDLSSYLASVKQERPIIYLLANFLWKRKIKFQLEAKHKDLVVEGKHLEFKFNYDRVGEVLKGGSTGKWGVRDGIRQDVIDKKPDIFVWIICSRDLSKVAPDELDRICFSREQRNYNRRHPYNSDREFLAVVDALLAELQAERSFSVLAEEIVTTGDFPSTYRFKICEFLKTT